MKENFKNVSVDDVRSRINSGRINNTDRAEGTALVNVLLEDAFNEEHIPDSINIPVGEESKFEEKFSKNKEIIVYCASQACTASPSVARKLTEAGFQKVMDFEGGMKEWKEKGFEVAGNEAGRATANY